MMNAILLADATTIAAIIAVVLGVLLLSFFLLLARQFKRCPSNRVLVIYGKTFRAGHAGSRLQESTRRARHGNCIKEGWEGL